MRYLFLVFSCSLACGLLEVLQRQKDCETARSQMRCSSLSLEPIPDVIRYITLGWFEHVCRMPRERLIKITYKMISEDQEKEDDHEKDGAIQSWTPAANNRAVCSRQEQMAGCVIRED